MIKINIPLKTKSNGIHNGIFVDWACVIGYEFDITIKPKYLDSETKQVIPNIDNDLPNIFYLNMNPLEVLALNESAGAFDAIEDKLLENIEEIIGEGSCERVLKDVS